MADGGVALVVDKIPLVHHHHKALLVALYQREDVHILCLDAARGVDHQHAHVGGLDGADGADHRIVLDVLVHLVLLAYARRVDKVEVEAVFGVARVDAVAGGARDIGHNMALGADESVDYRRLARVRAADDGKLRQLRVDVLLLGVGFGQLDHHVVKQVARAVAVDGAHGVRVAEAQ